MSIKLFTHDGDFHSDEIFSFVLLSHFKNINEPIIRTRDQAILAEACKNKNHYVIDVGSIYDPEYLNFDHHQASFNLTNEHYEDTPYSSCGLIWKYLKENTFLNLNSFIINKIDDFVSRIDMLDNGIKNYYQLSIISACNYYPDDEQTKFNKALDIAKCYFNCLLKKWELQQQRYEIEKLALENAKDQIIFSEQKISVTPYLNASDNLLLVSKRNDNEWCIITLNSGYDLDFSRRCSAPESWGGLSGKELNEKSGFDNMVFCHKKLFLTIVNGDKDHALSVAKYIVDNHYSK